MSSKIRGEFVKGKFKMLKRTNTMHIPSMFRSPPSNGQLSRADSAQSLVDAEEAVRQGRAEEAPAACVPAGVAGDPEELENILRRGRRAAIIDKKIDKRSRSKECLLDLCEALQQLKTTEFLDTFLASFRVSFSAKVRVMHGARKEKHWTELQHEATKKSPAEDGGEREVDEVEMRRREAVWELFKSELIFLLDHLMVLKHVSYTFCRELISSLTKDLNDSFGQTEVLVRPLSRWSLHSKDGEVFHNYCLNYDCALAYLDVLRKYEQFVQFEKWCELDSRCRRLQLTDLLVSPMQHYTKIPLLLSSIRRYTVNESEQQLLSCIINNVETSLRSLEDKMRWLRNFERLQEIQSQLIWPNIQEMDTRVFIPEFLRHSLARQPSEKLIANPKRQLLMEGYLSLSDGSKSMELFAFLFDDFFLLTKIKKPPKKKSIGENPLVGKSPTEGAIFVVHRQPIALDRFTIHDIGLAEANANGIKNAFVLVVITRFQQITGVYTLQAQSESVKTMWVEQLRESQQSFQKKLRMKISGKENGGQQTNKHSKLLVGAGRIEPDQAEQQQQQQEQKAQPIAASEVAHSEGLMVDRALVRSARTQSCRQKRNPREEPIQYGAEEVPTGLDYSGQLQIGSSFSPPLSPTLHPLAIGLPSLPFVNQVSGERRPPAPILLQDRTDPSATISDSAVRNDSSLPLAPPTDSTN